MSTGAGRPSVDVVVPFRGSGAALAAVARRMASIEVRPGDSVLIVDNTPGRGEGSQRPFGHVHVLGASATHTPAFARNMGAAAGQAEWLVFLDADTAPAPDLLERYFEPFPAPGTGLLAGGVLDEAVPPRAPLAPRYAYLRGAMSQDDTFSFGEWGYPKSANIACRRRAFEEVGGFRAEIRAAEDADLTYRLRAAGWGLERREDAAAIHLSRPTIGAMLKQQALWGSGGAWIDRHYPGSMSLAGGPGALRWALASTARTMLQAARRRERDALIYALVRPLEGLAWELGRLLPNERPVRAENLLRRSGR